MLETIRDLLSTNGTGTDGEATTPEAVREAISETEAELERARKRLDELNERHGKVLLHGTDEALDDHERKIELTERAISRLETAREELDTRLEEAKEAQEARRAAERAEEVMELHREGLELVEEYRELSEQMVEVCERLEEIDKEVDRNEDAFRKSPDHEVPPTPGKKLTDMSGSPAYERAKIPQHEPGAPLWNSRPWRSPSSRLSRASADGPSRPKGPVVTTGEGDERNGRRRA